MQITKRHLAFVQEANGVFEDEPLRETCRSDDESLIALRMGMDRDCIDLYEFGEHIALFAQQMEPCPMPRRTVHEFSYDMEKQLKANDHKGGWQNEHFEFLLKEIFKNLSKLQSFTSIPDLDKHEITKRCANIANFAMMIADNEGEHL